MLGVKIDKRWLVGGGLVLVLAAGAIAWALWPAPAAEPLARQYRDASACLLTGEDGVSAATAAPVWAGLQSASARTHGQVRFLPVTGDQTAANAQTFVGTLLLGRCSVIVAAPGLADEAVRAAAGQHPAQRFLVVGGAEPAAANVSRVDGPDVAGQVSAAVGEQLTSPR